MDYLEVMTTIAVIASRSPKGPELVDRLCASLEKELRILYGIPKLLRNRNGDSIRAGVYNETDFCRDALMGMCKSDEEKTNFTLAYSYLRQHYRNLAAQGEDE